MEELIKKLQKEVDLTEDQAIKAVSIVKDYIHSEGLDIDWERFFKEKYKEFSQKAEDTFSNASRQTQNYTDMIIDKVDDLADKARKKAHDLTQKAADFLNDK